MDPLGVGREIDQGRVQFHGGAVDGVRHRFKDGASAGTGFQDPVAVTHVRQRDHAAGQLGRCFVELVQFLEVGDLTGNDRFIHALGAVAVENVRADAPVPFAAEQFNDLGGLDVKIAGQLAWQMQSVSLAP